MNKPVIILGGGGHARVLVDCLQLQGSTILGITVPQQEREQVETRLGIPVLGDDQLLQGLHPSDVRLVNGIGSIRSTALRAKLFETHTIKGFSFASVEHPTSIIARDVVLSEGAQVMAGSIIQPGTCIGLNVIVNTRASIDHDCHIDDHVHIAPGAVLSGSVSVGKHSHIGAGATVIQGIRIGRECVIGAGAVVIRDIPDGTTVVGIPARPI